MDGASRTVSGFFSVNAATATSPMSPTMAVSVCTIAVACPQTAAIGAASRSWPSNDIETQSLNCIRPVSTQRKRVTRYDQSSPRAAPSAP